VYRQLSQQETYPKGQGLVTKSTLERVLSYNKVQLTKHEFKMLSQMFIDPNKGEAVNYQKMSEELGLHSKKLSMI